MTIPIVRPRSCDDLGRLPSPVQELTERTNLLYASSSWLRVEQEVAPHAPMYVWEEDGAGAVAFAAAYRFDADSNPWPFARGDLFLQQQGVPESSAAEVLPSYLVGGRRPGHSDFLFTGDPRHRRDLLTRVIASAAEDAARRGAVTIAALYCDDHDDDLTAAFRENGGIPVPSFPNYALSLAGAAFDDWLAGLPPKQRLNEKADLRKLEKANVRCSVVPLTEDDIDWIVPLELELYHRYGNDYLVSEARSLHQAYLRHLGDDALLIKAERDGAAVGFASLIRIGDTAYLRQAGFDHDRCAGAPVYFGTVFHAAIKWAYAHHVKTLEYSISSDDVKKRRGCRALERSAWFVPLTRSAESALRDMRTQVKG